MKRFTLGSGLVGLCALMVAALAAPGCSSGTQVVSGSGGSNGSSSGGSNGSSSGGSNGSSSGGSNGSSSGGSNGSGSGGSDGSGSGGSNGSGSGGSNGSGSGGSNGSGSGGSNGGSNGGGGTAGGCTMKPTGDLIADFTAAGQVGMLYKGAETGLTAPTATTDGSLVITFDTGMLAAASYAYVGLPFSACFDASEYKGVKFKASGMLNTGCTIQFSTVDKEHNKPGDMGTCTATVCYASSKVFELASSPTDVTVNFADQTGGGADPGAKVVDPTQVTAIQWQLNVPATGGCKGTVTIDDITFVK